MLQMSLFKTSQIYTLTVSPLPAYPIYHVLSIPLYSYRIIPMPFNNFSHHALHHIPHFPPHTISMLILYYTLEYKSISSIYIGLPGLDLNVLNGPKDPSPDNPCTANQPLFN